MRGLARVYKKENQGSILEAQLTQQSELAESLKVQAREHITQEAVSPWKTIGSDCTAVPTLPGLPASSTSTMVRPRENSPDDDLKASHSRRESR